MTTETINKPKIENKKELKEPPKVAIVIWDDQTTPYDIVLHVLVAHMSIELEKAIDIMIEAELKGSAVCRVLNSRDIAESIVADALMCADVMMTNLTFSVEVL